MDCRQTRRRGAAGIVLAALLLTQPASGWRDGLAPALAAQAAPQALSAALDEIDALVAAAFARDGIGSITIGVVADGRLAWTRSYGMADMARQVPAGRESVYRIGSITKQFTGLMLLQLVERGTVRLSDPVEKYFPEVNRVQGRFPGAPPITLVQLATMTSGLGREPEDLNTYLKGPVSDWEQVLIAALPKTRYAHEPGTRYLYSNIGYAILGAALARAAGQPFTEYVRQQIFAPGLRSTGGLAKAGRNGIHSSYRLAVGHAVHLVEVDGHDLRPGSRATLRPSACSWAPARARVTAVPTMRTCAGV